MKNFIEYHILSKKYRKEADVDKLKDLIREFIEENEFNAEVDNDDFDKLAYENMLVFLQVQLFRTQKQGFLNLLNQNNNFKIIFNEFNKLLNYYNETIDKTKERRDYKIILDYFDAIKETLQFIYKNNLTTVFSNEILIVLKKIRNDFIINFDRFNKYMEWSRRKNNIHIYTPYYQCIKFVNVPKKSTDQQIQVQNREGLFIDSSYVVPLDYEYDQNKFKWLTEEIKNLLTSIHLLISENSQNDIEKKTEAIVKKSQINHIQVLGVFAALMAFIMTSTITLAKMPPPNPETLFLIFLIFVIGFAIFLLLLRISLEKEVRLLFISFLIIIMVSVVFSVIYKDLLLFK